MRNWRDDLRRMQIWVIAAAGARRKGAHLIAPKWQGNPPRACSAMLGLPCLPSVRDDSRRQGRRAAAPRLQVACGEP
jgi:hypothetical protein